MENLKKVNEALRHLYNLVVITGNFDEEERNLFCSYLEYLHNKSECKEIVKRIKKGEKCNGKIINNKTSSRNV